MFNLHRNQKFSNLTKICHVFNMILQNIDKHFDFQLITAFIHQKKSYFNRFVLDSTNGESFITHKDFHCDLNILKFVYHFE